MHSFAKISPIYFLSSPCINVLTKDKVLEIIVSNMAAILKVDRIFLMKDSNPKMFNKLLIKKRVFYLL